MAAVRYVERNPVRAGLVKEAWDWPWSSAAYHVGLLDEDPLVTEREYFGPVHDWRALLSSEPQESERLRPHVRTGRPLGSRGFIATAERLLGRRLRPRPAGRPSKDEKSVLCPTISMSHDFAGKRVPVAMPDSQEPQRPHDIRGRWVEDAEWSYGGVGHAGFNTPHAGGGCACWYCRFSIDYFARSFAPEMDQYSVATLDKSGNLITRVGQYGNVDDGVPVIAGGGPAKTHRLGPAPGPADVDQVALFHAAYVASDTDRRLFIADLGNARILSVTLNYHATKKIALKDVV